jgi:hypothetical protein
MAQNAKPNQPFALHMKDGRPLTFAGLSGKLERSRIWGVAALFRVRLYERRAGEVAQYEPFYRANLSRRLQIATAPTAMREYRCCAAMMDRAFAFGKAVSHNTRGLCVSSPNRFHPKCWLFRSKVFSAVPVWILSNYAALAIAGTNWRADAGNRPVRFGRGAKIAFVPGVMRDSYCS